MQLVIIIITIIVGSRCEHLVSPCSSRPCRNGGTCVTADEGVPFSCKCPTGFFGNLCHLRATTPTTLITPTTLTTPATTDKADITSESGTSDVNGTDVWYSTTESIVMTTETDDAGFTSPHCIFTGVYMQTACNAEITQTILCAKANLFYHIRL